MLVSEIVVVCPSLHNTMLSLELVPHEEVGGNRRPSSWFVDCSGERMGYSCFQNQLPLKTYFSCSCPENSNPQAACH